MASFTLPMLVILWYAIGVASFIFWWLKDFDLTREDLIISLWIGGPLGLLMFPLGWLTHRENKKDMELLAPKVIIKRRNKDGN